MSNELDLRDPAANTQALIRLFQNDVLLHHCVAACGHDGRFTAIDTLRACVLAIAWDRDRYKKIVMDGELLKPPSPIIFQCGGVESENFLQQRREER